ncbi:uracil-O(2)--methyltransferase [Cadophora sp. MPI-SDFR-AT-0126]|nr:uracil-O(2)--methyltransferase [Leotiomycetes sp. MPI-SDFR-AT-0126]
MPFTPDSTPPGTLPTLEESSGEIWTPLYTHGCSFPPEIFREVMLNLIRNPNINSNHLFRADISLDFPFEDGVIPESNITPRITQFKGFTLKRVMVRTMIPRNVLVDKPLDQTCNFYQQVNDGGEILSLVIYLPHISSASESPFYHPAVHGIGFLHTFNTKTQEGIVAIHYSFFKSEPRSTKLERTALHLLSILHKHGQGSAAGYVKRVQHDVILPQAQVQNTYTRLKSKYARDLVLRWVETTDPGKHVFEDLSIAAFLIELWAEMYKDKDFPGFVDIGCGNGLLVHILLEEGYSGWGFDARRRRSWQSWSPRAQENLKELVLIPSIIGISANEDAQASGTHNGIFPKGTFIVSNHADELTPWTPLLANISECPFMMIPCCSHSLSGSRFRAPPPKDGSSSAYASLVAWVSRLAKYCGWDVEKEMLRIPSTRNTALIGRRRAIPFEDVDVHDLVLENGGAAGWEENALKLVKGSTRGH